MAINWGDLTHEQRQAVTALMSWARLDSYHRQKHTEALIAAKATGVSYNLIADVLGVPRDTIISRYRTATRRKSDEH